MITLYATVNTKLLASPVDETIPLRVHYTNDPGCSSTGPTVAGNLITALPCAGQSFEIEGTGADTYEWFDGSFATSLGTFDTLSVAKPQGTYEFYVIGTETATSLSDTDTVVVNVSAGAPTPTIDNLNGNYCDNDPPITVAGTPGGGTVSIDGSIVTGGVFDPSALGPGTYVVTYAVTNACGTGSVDSTVVVDPCAVPTVCTPGTFPVGTPYGFDPQPAPQGEINVTYDETVQMILPSSSAELGVPGGLPVDSFRIMSVVGMPTGLTWETSQGTSLPQTIDNPASSQPVECFQITGTPLVTTATTDSVYFQLEAYIMGFAAPTTLALHIPIKGSGGAPVVSSNPANPTVCNGNAVTLTAQGATTYEWYSDAALTNSLGTGASQTFSPTANTTYWIVGTDGGLSDTASVTVSVIACGGGLPCTPTAPAANDPWGFDPNPAPNGTVGSYYQETADMIFPGSSGDVGLVGLNIDIDSISINSIYNVPAGLSYYTNQGGLLPQTYVANPVGTKPYGCVTFLGTPTAPTSATDSVYFALTVYAQGISIPLTVGYHIPIDANTTPPTVSITPTSASICSGQSVTLFGNGADSYEWQVGGTAVSVADSFVFSGTTTTEVILIGTAAGSGLSANDTLEVTVSNCGALQFSTQTTDANCNGAASGEILFSSTQNLTYSIDGGATTQSSGVFAGLTAGIYDCEVSDGTNDSTFTLTINEPAAISFTANGSAASCAESADGSINFANVSGGVPPYAYSIGGQNFTQNTNIGNLVGGTYDAYVQDANGCELSQSVTVSAPDSIAITGLVTNSASDVPTGEIDITVSGGDGNYTFVWSSGDATEDLTGIGADDYTVTVTDGNGCTGTATFTVSEETSREGALNNLSATVFPNPTSGKVFIQTSKDIGQSLTVNVFDLSGRLVQTTELPTGTAVLDMNGQAAGVYLLELTAGDRREVKRVVLK